jgi:hypothetical protein
MQGADELDAAGAMFEEQLNVSRSAFVHVNAGYRDDEIPENALVLKGNGGRVQEKKFFNTPFAVLLYDIFRRSVFRPPGQHERRHQLAFAVPFRMPPVGVDVNAHDYIFLSLKTFIPAMAAGLNRSIRLARVSTHYFGKHVPA